MKNNATVSRRIGFAGVLVLLLLLTGMLVTSACAASITTSAIKEVCSRYGFKSGAYWTYDTTVSFLPNGENDVSGVTAPVSGEIGTPITLPDSGFTREGYTFTGWRN